MRSELRTIVRVIEIQSFRVRRLECCKHRDSDKTKSRDSCMRLNLILNLRIIFFPGLTGVEPRFNPE